MEEPCGAPRQLEVVDEVRGGPRLREEGEQLGERVFLPRAVEEPLQPGMEEVLEGPLQQGAVEESLQLVTVEELCGEVEVPVQREPARSGSQGTT